MPGENGLNLIRLIDAKDVTPALRQGLIDCWIEVTNTGGAAGFPFPPVDGHQVAPVANALIGSLKPDHNRLILASRNGGLVGWVSLTRSPSPVVAHWGRVRHLQTHPAHRGQGHGSALVTHLRRIARDEMGLEQLHLAARGGVGLEDFYTRLGWREVGRWPNALRFAIDDTRDEILMVLTPI